MRKIKFKHLILNINPDEQNVIRNLENFNKNIQNDENFTQKLLHH